MRNHEIRACNQLLSLVWVQPPDVSGLGRKVPGCPLDIYTLGWKVPGYALWQISWNILLWEGCDPVARKPWPENLRNHFCSAGPCTLHNAILHADPACKVNPSAEPNKLLYIHGKLNIPYIKYWALHYGTYTLDPALWVLHSGPVLLALHCTPCTVHPALHTLQSTPCTLHPALYTLPSIPCTLHSAPCTLHSTPWTLHPELYTLHSTPCTADRAHWILHSEHCSLDPALWIYTLGLTCSGYWEGGWDAP